MIMIKRLLLSLLITYQHEVYLEYYLQIHSLSRFDENIKLLNMFFYSHGTLYLVTLIR